MKKKTITIIVLVIIALIISILLLLHLNDTEKIELPFLDGLSNKQVNALEVYSQAIDEAKNATDFDVQVTTRLQLDNIECSSSLISSTINQIINHRLTDDTVKYSFVNGVSVNDSAITPNTIIQPMNSKISESYFDRIITYDLYQKEDFDTVCFVIEKETADIALVTKAFDEFGAYYNYGYDIHKEYPTVNSLAVTHSNFIDIMSVINSVMCLFVSDTGGSKVNSEVENTATQMAIKSGSASLGKSRVYADIDENGRLLQASYYVPVVFDITVGFFNSNINAVIEFQVYKNYSFTY